MARRDPDRCSCGSDDLFSGHFDEEGYAVPQDMGDPRPTPPGVKWTTYCNTCGDEVVAPAAAAARADRARRVERHAELGDEAYAGDVVPGRGIIVRPENRRAS